MGGFVEVELPADHPYRRMIGDEATDAKHVGMVESFRPEPRSPA
ncbi:MAG: hypothetical protein ACRD0S_04925 [Acidimicrobiales bacterium]